MSKKYQNLVQTPLFGSYVDPYADRRGNGAVRPGQPLPSVIPDLKRVFDRGTLHAAWLGHSSVMLAAGEKRILIDPVFCKFTSPLPFAGPKRFPGKTLSAKDFPELDLVLITHSHYDHLDRKTIRNLDKQIKQYVVPAGLKKILTGFGAAPEKIAELSWYEAWTGIGLQVVLTPSQHGSARSPFDQNRTLWGSYFIKWKNYTVFDTGDGGFGEHFSQFAEQYGNPDLAIMECGQYNERWHGVHMFPEESVQAAVMLGAKLAVPVHWGAYVLSDHAWDDPPKRFSRYAEELGVSYKIPILNQWIHIEKEGAKNGSHSD